MKSNLFKALSYCLFSILLLNAGQMFAQGVVPKSSEQKTMKAESVKPNPQKGEYNHNGECADLIVKKGCVNYKVCVAGAKDCDKLTPVKVCFNAQSKKPTNICRKGAKGITVKWEKLDPNTDIEFK